MNIRVLVADTESNSREWICRELSNDPDLDVIAACADGLEAESLVRRTQPDLLVSEVDLPGLDAFGILEKRERLSAPGVILLSRSAKHAVAAFEANAIDYLLKPISASRLREAVTRGKEWLERRALEEPLQWMPRLGRVRRYLDWLFVKKGDRRYFVRVRDVDWIESERNHVRLHVGKECHLYEQTTKGIESQLDPSQFLRIHRSAIVNIERIDELYRHNGDYAVTLKNGTKLIMTERYKHKLRAFRRGVA
jgi:two-component system, LytTR family, response regulator